MKSLRILPFACLAGALAALAAAPAVADDEARSELRRDVREGSLLSLAVLFDALESCYRGQILEAELERDETPARYEIEMVGPAGQIVEFEFDAESGALLKMEGVRLDEMKRANTQWDVSGARCESTAD